MSWCNYKISNNNVSDDYILRILTHTHRKESRIIKIINCRTQNYNRNKAQQEGQKAPLVSHILCGFMRHRAEASASGTGRYPRAMPHASGTCLYTDPPQRRSNKARVAHITHHCCLSAQHYSRMYSRLAQVETRLRRNGHQGVSPGSQPVADMLLLGSKPYCCYSVRGD
jgi:hypothetical protein